jgi:hypothetical protein
VARHDQIREYLLTVLIDGRPGLIGAGPISGYHMADLHHADAARKLR